MKLIILCLLLPCFVFADEGMWTFDNVPVQKIKKSYNFSPSENWLNHVQLSSARLAGGCSASFVSKNGLVMTNHHCASSCIEQLSTAKKDYIVSGFLAEKIENEVKCPEIEINRLISIVDVTDRIHKATQNIDEKNFNEKLRGEMSTIEKECSNNDDFVRCDVVSLYQGGKYNLYRYQRYQDVRLVFAPEMAIAFFGGDPDNFNFPRYDLDMTFLRVYENNKPLNNPHYFAWSKNGAIENELSFVTGHPGGTSRNLTIEQLKFTRDVRLINYLVNIAEIRGILTEFQKRGEEQKRISTATLFGIENAYKSLMGRLKSLQNEDFFNSKIVDEKKLQAKVNANPKLKKLYGKAWSEIANALKVHRNIYKELDNIEYTNFGSKYYSLAKNLVRYSAESKKPNAVRFREYRDSSIPELKQSLFSQAPIYNEYEVTMFTYALTKARERLGADHPIIQKVFGQASPEEIAKNIIEKTQLKDVNFRKKLFEGGPEAIASSSDPMINFFKQIDPIAREIRKKYEDTVETRIKKYSEQIAQARFAIYGTQIYPDATFTLRLSYGQVKGYLEDGKTIKPITNMAGAFARHTGREPYKLPDSWLNAKAKLNLDTPMNFCSSNDIIGGNSGSPIINKNAEIIGLIFDGNIQSLGGDYGFDESVNRAVAVHSQAIIESLSKIYNAQRILDDILQP